MADRTRSIRLENTDADFEKRGVRRGPVEVWEDGRRDNDRAGAMEWWYFDAVLDGGTKVVAHFHTKQPTNSGSNAAHPQAGLVITLPDGTVYEDQPFYKPEEVSFAGNHCDVHFGPNYVNGDLKHYEIHYENINGIGADLKIDSLSSSWRPGTAYYDFGDGKYYTWLCVVPKGRLSGTLTYNGRIVNAAGYAYHDHQWLNINSMEALNHWLWARQAIGDDYTVLNFDIIASKKYDYQRLPMFVIQDNEGKVIFECTKPGDMVCEIINEYYGHEVGKDYPKVTHYIYRSKGLTAEYTLTADHENYIIDVINDLPKELRKKSGMLGSMAAPLLGWFMKHKFSKQGIRPSYANYSATGHLVLKDADGKVLIDKASPLIYEFVFMGLQYRKYMESKN